MAVTQSLLNLINLKTNAVLQQLRLDFSGKLQVIYSRLGYKRNETISKEFTLRISKNLERYRQNYVSNYISKLKPINTHNKLCI